MGGPPIPVNVPIKPDAVPAIVIFFLVATMFQFFALMYVAIKSKTPNTIKYLFVPSVKNIKGIASKEPTTLPL